MPLQCRLAGGSIVALDWLLVCYRQSYVLAWTEGLTIIIMFQLQELILSGDLPCSKEEAATLAGIHLHLDEAWPEVGGANYSGPYPIREKMTDRGKSTKTNERDRQENLRKKKELIRNNKVTYCRF